jgi:hypothetical protein
MYFIRFNIGSGKPPKSRSLLSTFLSAVCFLGKTSSSPGFGLNLNLLIQHKKKDVACNNDNDLKVSRPPSYNVKSGTSSN